MPSQFNPGTQRFCHPCEFLKHEHVLYGHDFVRGDYVCHHPEANELGPVSSDPHVAAKQGELRAKMEDYGRLISKHHDHRPSWCPLYRERAEPAPPSKPEPPKCRHCGGIIKKKRVVFDFEKPPMLWEHVGEKLSHQAEP